MSVPFPLVFTALAVGLSLLFAALFRPLIKGIFSATKLLLFPRKPRADREAEALQKSRMALLAAARNAEHSQPNLAQELRGFASR